MQEWRCGWSKVVAVVGIVSEAGALVRGIFLVGGDVVGVAKGGCGKGALADGAEGAVTCGGAMVSSTVGAEEFGVVAG